MTPIKPISAIEKSLNILVGSLVLSGELGPLTDEESYHAKYIVSSLTEALNSLRMKRDERPWKSQRERGEIEGINMTVDKHNAKIDLMLK